MILSTSTNILHERIPIETMPVQKSIELCSSVGYRHMDFCFVDEVFGKTQFLSDDWEKYVESIVELAYNSNIVFTQSHAHLHDFCNSTEAFEWELMCRCVCASKILSVKWMAVHPSTVDDVTKYEENRLKNIEYFRRLSDYAGKYNIGIAIENMWGTTKSGVQRYATSTEELMDLVKAVNAENVGVCWDTVHAGVENIDQESAIMEIGAHLKATHISDYTDRTNIHILPFMGVINWRSIVNVLGEINYSGDFTYELQHYLWKMPLAVCEKAISLSYDIGTMLTGGTCR